MRSLVNGCFRVVGDNGARSDPYYYFSVDADVLPQQPWRQGTVYILPRAGFEQQPPLTCQGREREVAQWASLSPVRPLAWLSVAPDDFPFLAQVRGHDMAAVTERAAREPTGFPWLDE